MYSFQSEADLYKEAEKDNGWRLFKPFKVARKVAENEEVTSFYLLPKDSSTLPESKPGQYITIRVTVTGDEYKSNRHYTLSQPSNNNEFRISVKREDVCDPIKVIS